MSEHALQCMEVWGGNRAVNNGVVMLGLELGLGIGLLIPGLSTAAALGAVALLGTYTAAIAINLSRGRRDIDCGCGGPVPRALSGGLVARNTILMVAFAASALPETGRELVWLDGFTVLATLAILGFLYVAEETLASHRIAPWAQRDTP